MKLTTRLLGATAIACAAAAVPAHAQNLVTNGSFESGSFSGFTTTGNALFVVQSNSGFGNYTANDGRFYAALGTTTTGGGTISQTLSTVAGQSYTLSYFLASNGTTPNFFNASWNGNVIAGSSLTNVATQPFTRYAFTLTGTGSDVLTFSEQNVPNYLGLDNISVVANVAAAVPEPGTWAMMILGLGVVGFAMRRKQNVTTRVSYAA